MILRLCNAVCALGSVVCLSVQMEVSELTSQLVQQTDYCSSMGSACCTLLWRVSQQEEVVPSILGGVGPQLKHCFNSPILACFSHYL